MAGDELAVVEARRRRGRRRRAGRRRLPRRRLPSSALDEVRARHAARARRGPARGGRPGGTRTGRRTARENVDGSLRPGLVRRVRAARGRGAAAPARARGPRAATRRPTGSSVASRTVAGVSDRSCCRTTTRCSRARRGSRTTARRTGSSSSRTRRRRPARAVRRRRRRPARRHRRARRFGARLPRVRALRRAVRPRAARRGRRRAAASPATPRCSAAATSIIATEGSNIGMGGPAMIEGGGLGVYAARRDRPAAGASRQRRRRRRSCPTTPPPSTVGAALPLLLPRATPSPRTPTTGTACAASSPRTADAPTTSGPSIDGARRHRLVPGAAARVRRRAWSPALARVEGRALGVVANDPTHLGGAIDPDGADKAARFMQLCDAFDLPLLFLCDTPGFMVGPDDRGPRPRPPRGAALRRRGEPDGAVRDDRGPQGLRARRAGDGRRELQGARRSASAGRPARSAAWASRVPCGSASVASSRPSSDPAERDRVFDEMVERAYANGRALNAASWLRARRRHRPRRLAPLDHVGVRRLGAARSHGQEAAVRRHLVRAEPSAGRHPRVAAGHRRRGRPAPRPPRGPLRRARPSGLRRIGGSRVGDRASRRQAAGPARPVAYGARHRRHRPPRDRDAGRRAPGRRRRPTATRGWTTSTTDRVALRHDGLCRLWLGLPLLLLTVLATAVVVHSGLPGFWRPFLAGVLARRGLGRALVPARHAPLVRTAVAP